MVIDIETACIDPSAKYYAGILSNRAAAHFLVGTMSEDRLMTAKGPLVMYELANQAHYDRMQADLALPTPLKEKAARLRKCLPQAYVVRTPHEMQGNELRHALDSITTRLDAIFFRKDAKTSARQSLVLEIIYPAAQ